MNMRDYYRLSVVHLLLTGMAFFHAGVQAENIDLPKGKGRMEVESFSFPLPSNKQTNKTSIPQSIGNQSAKPIDAGVNNVAPEAKVNSELAKQQLVAQPQEASDASEESYAESTVSKFGGGL
jgi:hypothetical protein